MKSAITRITTIYGTYLALLTFVMIMIRNSAVTGYELSIYTSIPPFTWFFLIGSIAIGVGFIVHQAFNGSRNNMWLMGFFVLALNNLTVTCLPGLKGYFLYYPVDPLVHLAMTKDILLTGHLSENPYPLEHILMAYIAQICNLPLETITKYLPGLLSVLYMIYMVLLAKVGLGKRGQVLLVAASSAPLLFGLFHTAVWTESFSFLSFPLLLYLYFRTREASSVGHKTSFIIILMAYPFMHPRSATALLVSLVSMELVRVIYNVVRRNNRKAAIRFRDSLKQISVNQVLINFITFFVWYAYYTYVFDWGVRNTASATTGKTPLGTPWVEKVWGAIELQGTDLIEFFLRMYGTTFIYSAISLIGTLMILRKILRDETRLKNMLLLVVWWVVGELFYLIAFYMFKATTLGRLTVLFNLLLLSPLFVGFVFHRLLTQPASLRKLRALKILIVLIITLASTVSMFNLYRSPLVFQANPQVTYMDVQGTRWLLDHKMPWLVYTGLFYPHTYAYPVMGYATSLSYHIERSMWSIIYQNKVDIPSHFGYDSFKTFGEQFVEDKYVVITRVLRLAISDPTLSRGRVLHPPIDRWDFTQDDLTKLELDSTVNRVYSNGELDIYYVMGTAW